MIDNMLYFLFFAGSLILVLCLADLFGKFCIWIIESGKHRPMGWHVAQAKKKRYNKKLREFR